MATFVHDGKYVDHTPQSAVAAGQVVVQADLVGVAVRDIPANTLGALATEGVFSFPKATGASTAIAAGTSLYWASGTSTATATASGNKLIGKAVKAAADADATVLVKLFQ
jgi:predicted RecA/RadA family phage recombinase